MSDLFAPTPGQQHFGLGLPQYDDLLDCIRCGRCLPVCPTYQQTQLEMFSPRGRLNLMRAVEDGQLDLTTMVEEHLYHCLDCRACNTVCPPGIHIGELIVQGRVAAVEKRPRPWLMRFVLERVLISPERLEMLSPPLRLAQALRLDQFGAWLLGEVPGLGPALRDLVQMSPRIPKPLRLELPVVTPATGAKRQRVAFFLGCIMNVAMADVSRATVRVLSRLGCEVVTPRGQACCGAPQDDQALRALSRDFARRNIELFEQVMDDVGAIVTDCAGCGGSLKEYAEWLHDDPQWAERAKRFSAKVQDVTEYLDAIWPESQRARFPQPLRAAYHDPCHLSNVQGVRQQPRRLLAHVDGLTMKEIPNSTPTLCCGSAGIYNITHTPMALELLERKMADIESTGAQMIVTANPGCMLQLQWGCKRDGVKTPVKHVVEILDESLLAARD